MLKKAESQNRMTFDQNDLFDLARGDEDSPSGASHRDSGGERMRARSAELRRHTGVGLHSRLVQEIKKQYRGDPRKQIAVFLERATLPAATGRKREVGEKTRSDYGFVLQQCVTDLRERKIFLENIPDLNQKHAINLVRYWGEQQHAEGTIQWRISILRRFLSWIGRESVIPKGRIWRQTLHEHGIRAGTNGRSNIAVLAKGWVDLGIDPKPIIAAVWQDEPVAGCCLEMMWALGLRFSETVQIQPRISDKGEYISVYRGTKGGKLREVPFSTDSAKRAWQREVLERAKVLADKHPKGILAVRGLRLEQMKNRLRYLVRQHGVNKRQLGISPHGLRHQFGTDLFRDLTGLPAPVLEQLPPAAYVEHAEKVRWALLEVSRQMGHERPSISAAYLSSVPRMNRVETSRLADWLAKLACCGEEFQAAGVTQAWVVGKCAFGLPISQGSALQVAVRLCTFDGSTAAMLRQLGVTLGATLDQRVTVLPWMDTDRPDEGAEILFRGSRLSNHAPGLSRE